MEQAQHVADFISAHLALIMSVIVGLLGWRLGAEGLAAFKATLREKQVLQHAEWAYEKLAEIARKTPNKYDDMAAEFLRLFNDGLKLSGLAASTEDEEKAKLFATMLHQRDTKAGVDHTTLAAYRSASASPEAQDEGHS